MNKRDFVKMLGLGAVGVVTPQNLSAEGETAHHIESGDEVNPIGNIEFRILPAGDGPAEVEFSDGRIVPFLNHPETLLVMAVTEMDEDGYWRNSYVHWRPIKSTELGDVLLEIGYLCRNKFGYWETDTDYEMDSHGERMDEERATKKAYEHERMVAEMKLQEA
jgi:hypothetical protein